jgi:hypothetical protein
MGGGGGATRCGDGMDGLLKHISDWPLLAVKLVTQFLDNVLLADLDPNLPICVFAIWDTVGEGGFKMGN